MSNPGCLKPCGDSADVFASTSNTMKFGAPTRRIKQTRPQGELRKWLAPFRFLDLPAELRNRIYEFAVDSDSARVALCHKPDRKRHARQMLALTQVCRQIRTEYRPGYLLQSRISLRWQELPIFVSTFYPNLASYKNAPAELIIQFFDQAPEGVDRSITTVDTMPLFNMKKACPTFFCEFYHIPNGQSGLDDFAQDWVGTNSVSIPNFDNARCIKIRFLFNAITWMNAIEVGNIEEVKLCYDKYPRLNILAKRDAAPRDTPAHNDLAGDDHFFKHLGLFKEYLACGCRLQVTIPSS